MVRSVTTMGDLPEIPPPPSFQKVIIKGDMGLPMELTITSRQCGAASPLAKPKEYKPCFHRELKDTEVEAGDVVVFHCEFSCQPPPNVIWYKEDDKIVENGDKVLIYTEKYESMLVLADVHEPDSGEYTVVVSNCLGEIASSAELTVIIKEERWIRLQDKAKVRTQSLEAAINSLSDFEIAANRLETWLNEKAKMLAVLGPIGIEPDILKNQKSQVEVLQDEFDSHKGQLDNLQDAARAILDKQDSNTRSRSPIQHQINEIQEQWEDLKRQLDDREGQLDNVLKESEPFHETKQDLNDWLIDFSNRISSLPAISQNPELVKQQREHTKALQKEADRKKQQLASMGDHHQQLVKLNPELTAMSEVELKLESVQSPYDDWCRKLDERLGKLQAALVQSQDFEDALDNMARWLDSKDKEVSSPKPISARPDVLRRQVIEHEELPKEIVKQVYTYQRLADKMDSLVQESESGPERRALEQKRDDMKSRWTDLERRVAERKDRLVDCSEKAKEYTDECNQFLPWLRSVEDRINSLGPVLMKPNVVKRQYDIFRQLQDDINRHKDNHRALNDNSERLVRCTDVDHPFIRDQVKDINTRWDKLNADVARNVETLEGLNDRLSTFQENVNQSSSLLASCEGRLANQDSGRDRLSLDNLKDLQGEIDVLENTIVAVQDNSSHLMSAAPSQADTTQINDEVDGMVRRYQKLKGIVNDKYMQLEAGNQEVVKYQSSLNDISSQLSKQEDDLDRMDPVARDLPTLDKQNKDIQTFQDDLELLKGTILKAETAYKDIIDRGFMSDPEGFREQIENINKRWLKIRERANTRHADIDRTNARMQDLKHLFDEVNGGLDKAEMEIRGWKPVGADVDTIKRQEKEFKAYMRNLVDPLTPRVRDANRLCQNLVQSAAPRVSTTALEGDLKRMNDRWNSLLEKNNQRRGNLNEGLLRCGKFQEALQSLLSWISDTEAMVKNQSGPSSDYNVLKAQMSEQQLCDRIITDREPSVSSLKEMGEQLAKVSDPQDRMRIQQQLSDLERRWNNLKDTVKDRRQKLEQTERLARDFHDNVDSMNSWLEGTENNFASQGPVATSRSQVRSQMKYQQDMHEDISKHKPALETLQENGQELLKLCAGKERVEVQQRLDTVQHRYDGVTHKSEDRLNQLNQALPLATEFEEKHEELSTWLDDAEKDLQSLDGNAPAEEQKQKQQKLQQAINEHKPVLERLNVVGKQLIELSPGPGANNVKETLDKDNKRFEDLSKQVKDVEYQLSAMQEGAQKLEHSLDSLLHWVDETGMQLEHVTRESVSIDPMGVKDQLKKSKVLDKEVNSKSSRVQDALGAAEKVIEKTTDPKQKARLEELADGLRKKYEDLANKSDNRVDVLEETFPLAMQFNETHQELAKWLDDMEAELKEDKPIPLEPEELRKEVEENRFMKKNIAEKKQHVDKLNKIAPELVKLSPGTGASSVQAKVDDDNKRYENIKTDVDKKGDKMFDMLQRASSFVEDLDSMLDELHTYEDKLKRPEAIAADPEPLRRQIKKVRNLQDHVDSQMETVEALRKAGSEMISAAPTGDPHAKELKGKLDKLSSKWDGLARTANQRASDLQETLVAAELFRSELGGTTNTIQDLENQLSAEDLPAATTKDLQSQLDLLTAIKEDVEAHEQDLDLCQQSGQDLLKLCGDTDKPEVQRNLDDLSKSWENLKDGICKREEDLKDALETAEKFEVSLEEMKEFIDKKDKELETWPPVGADPETIKQQLDDLKDFKKTLDEKNMDLEIINREANKLVANCEEDDKAQVTEPLADVNQNWKELTEKAQDRQHKLEAGLLALGHLESSLDELNNWMDRTEEVLLEQVPLTGDPKQDEVQLAKHKVLQNDILAHQVSVDSVNKAGQGFLATADNPEVARVIEGKLDTVNHKWEDLVQKSADRQQELEKCLGEAKTFQDQVDQLLDWLESTDKLISRAEPVGGLPDSAREQLDKHKALMKQFGDKEELLKKLLEEGAKMKEDIGPGGDNQGGISQKLQELDKKWNDSVQKAKEKQTQLEDALKNAQEFDVGLQDFIVWLTAAEKTLTNTKRPSTIYENVQKQICDHREFVKDVAGKREDVDKLDRLGTQLKYFSQKKDVIVIKNMLVNVQNRYQRVGSRCNEKTRELESGMKLAKQFDEQYRNLFDWLDENEKFMDDDRSVGTDPEFLKSQRLKHKEFQKKLSMVQPTYDGVVRAGRNLREKSNQEDTKLLNAMMTDLKDKWDLLSGKAVDRQRKLEEALLYSGQFKDALQSLLEWMYQVEPTLADDNPVHGDKDTVANLMDAHQGFQRDLASRKNSVRSVKKSAKGLMDKSSEDTSHLKTKLDELDTKWETVCELNVQKQARLEDALKEAEEFNSAVQNLLDSFAATEHSMKFSGPLAESEDKLTEQLENHKDAKRMLDAEKNRLNDVIRQGEDILSKCHPDAIPIVKRHLGILNARWEDIQALSEQKESRLNDALSKVQDDAELLDQVMEFLEDAEHKLAQQEIEPIPEDMEVVEKLLEEHNHFEESVASKQPDIDRLVKPHKRKRSVDSNSGIPISFDRSRRGRSSRPRSRDASPAADPVKNPKIAALDNQWKNVWLRAMNRRRALQDVQEKQNELQSMKNFNFEDWRARYLKWMQHKKARVMDFFRKLDHDRDGKLSRKDFIDGVADSNFDTTQPEMNAVVDYLDPLNEGFIDYKKFLNALYPDSERSKQPATEAEKIANEVERQVCKCQCTKKFKVQKLGESKYRFGDSQMMRLVRILRSTVMVRVGGGWMALDEFLVKNDPCRAKGRTNIEIKEKFILASGVSQSMAAFRRSRSPSECSTSSVGSSSMSGSPFIKSKRNIKRPWQQGHTTTPRVTSTTRVNPDGSFTRTTREAKGGGDSVTRKSTTRSVTPGYLDTPRSSRGTRAKSPLGGVATKKKVLAQRTEVDVEEKKTSVGTQGLVTVRTVTEEERTVTKPTHRHTVNATSRLMEPTTSSRRKQKQAKPPAPRWK